MEKPKLRELMYPGLEPCDVLAYQHALIVKKYLQKYDLEGAWGLYLTKDASARLPDGPMPRDLENFEVIHAAQCVLAYMQKRDLIGLCGLYI